MDSDAVNQTVESLECEVPAIVPVLPLKITVLFPLHIHSPSGIGAIPTISTRRVGRSITKNTRYLMRPTLLHTSTVKKPAAAMASQCALRNLLQGNRLDRSGAETTSGGSGGPVFSPDGTVIGVNSAITRDFDGSNFGVPIDFASRLLPSSISAGGKE